MDILALAGFVIPITVYLFAQGILPPKHEMLYADLTQDPWTSYIFTPEDVAKREAQFINPEDWPKYDDNGFKVVRIAQGKEMFWGRKCVWTGLISDGRVMECFLVAKPKKKVNQGA